MRALCPDAARPHDAEDNHGDSGEGQDIQPYMTWKTFCCNHAGGFCRLALGRLYGVFKLSRQHALAFVTSISPCAARKNTFDSSKPALAAASVLC